MEIDITKLTWEDIAKIDKEKFVVFLGIAPIEEHGKHLPIGVDLFETQAWISLSIQRLEHSMPNFTFGTLPTIPFGFADMGNFPGNIHVSENIIHELVLNTLTNIFNWGVKHIIVISAHADPLHAIAIEKACETVNQKYGVISIAPMGSLFSRAQKGNNVKESEAIKEKQQNFPGDFHAGWVETSCMLALMPALVNPIYKKLPTILIDGESMMNPQQIAEKISGEGHIGYPKEASAELGHDLNLQMAMLIEEAATHFLSRSDYKQYTSHPLRNILNP